MAISSITFASLLPLLLLVRTSEQLSDNFYAKSCPHISSIVKRVVQSAITKEKRMGASLLRLFFHDCFVQGCDGSILLDDTSSFKGEQTASPNNNSIRGYKVINKIKAAVEKACPGVVSCADILAIAARDSVVFLGGPNWNVKLGRRDSKTANFDGAVKNLPSPTSNLGTLISKFSAQGLSTKDMVALSGGHTIGGARCASFREHIYNDANIDSSFAKARQAICPNTNGSGDSNLAPLDYQSTNLFDVSYYKDLISKKALLHSDQELFNNGSTDSLVIAYSRSQQLFHADFVAAMIKMGDINPLTGSDGEIRKNCGRAN